MNKRYIVLITLIILSATIVFSACVDENSENNIFGTLHSDNINDTNISSETDENTAADSAAAGDTESNKDNHTEVGDNNSTEREYGSGGVPLIYPDSAEGYSPLEDLYGGVFIPGTDFYDIMKYTNLLNNKPYEVSSEWNDSTYIGANTLNENVTDRWASRSEDVMEYSDRQWLLVDMEDVYKINAIVMAEQGHSLRYPGRSGVTPYFLIEVSSDKINWAQAFIAKGVKIDSSSDTEWDNAAYAIVFNEIEGRYIRITIKNSKNPSLWCFCAYYVPNAVNGVTSAHKDELNDYF